MLNNLDLSRLEELEKERQKGDGLEHENLQQNAADGNTFVDAQFGGGKAHKFTGKSNLIILNERVLIWKSFLLAPFKFFVNIFIKVVLGEKLS